MPRTALPTFRFHPDPLRSGSVVAKAVTCRACDQRRDHVYTGPVFGEHDLDEALCPWCIADGTANRRFGAFFHDLAFASEVAPDVAIEIEERTPGFDTWNPIDWPVCCDLPMAYLETAGIAEVRARHRTLEGDLMSSIVHELRLSGGTARAYLESLRRDASPSVHVFHCLSCDHVAGRIDSC